MKTVLPRFKTYGKQVGDIGKDEVSAVVPPVRRDTPKKKKKKK